MAVKHFLRRASHLPWELVVVVDKEPLVVASEEVRVTAAVEHIEADWVAVDSTAVKLDNCTVVVAGGVAGKAGSHSRRRC